MTDKFRSKSLDLLDGDGDDFEFDAVDAGDADSFVGNHHMTSLAFASTPLKSSVAGSNASSAGGSPFSHFPNQHTMYDAVENLAELGAAEASPVRRAPRLSLSAAVSHNNSFDDDATPRRTSAPAVSASEPRRRKVTRDGHAVSPSMYTGRAACPSPLDRVRGLESRPTTPKSKAQPLPLVFEESDDHANKIDGLDSGDADEEDLDNFSLSRAREGDQPQLRGEGILAGIDDASLSLSLNGSHHFRQEAAAAKDSNAPFRLQTLLDVDEVELDTFETSMSLSPQQQSQTSAERAQPRAVLVVDQTLAVKTANDAACALFASNSAGLVSRRLPDLLGCRPGQPAPNFGELMQTPNGLRGRVFEARNQSKHVADVAVFAHPTRTKGIQDDQNATCYVVVLEEISSVKTSFRLSPSMHIDRTDSVFGQLFGRPETIESDPLDASTLFNDTVCKKLHAWLTEGTTSADALTSEQRQPLFSVAQHSNFTGFPIELWPGNQDSRDGSIVINMAAYACVAGTLSCTPSGHIIGVNNQLATILTGRSRSHLLRMNVADVLPSFFQGSQLMARLLPQEQGHVHTVSEGSYQGSVVHAHGIKLRIDFQVKHVVDKDGSLVYCLWMSLASAPQRHVMSAIMQKKAEEHLQRVLESTSMGSSPDSPRVADDAGPTAKEDATAASTPEDAANESSATEPTTPLSDAQLDLLEQRHRDIVRKHAAEAFQGDFSDKYACLGQIGSGAFGFVMLCQSKVDAKTMCVAKVIAKAKVLVSGWTKQNESTDMLRQLQTFPDDQYKGLVPKEADMLSRLSHPNIIALLDIVHNRDYFQMMMEYHGPGMDLFDLIDKNAALEEFIASYVFRQVADAVSYLHSLDILHRDIKVENVVVNRALQAKLIDFGAAAKRKPGQLFDTFCGTLEYCSPEVLSGNAYAGPELEMFSIGVSLFTTLFGEQPFLSIEETLSGIVHPPFRISRQGEQVLSRLLHPNPKKRMTVQELCQHAWIVKDVSRDLDELLSSPEWQESMTVPSLEADPLPEFCDEEAGVPAERRARQSEPAINTSSGW